MATSFAGAATLFQAVFSIVWAPIVYKWVGKADEIDVQRIDRVTRQVLAAVCAIFFASGIFSWLIDFLLPIEYSRVKYLVLCAIVQPLLYTLSEVTCVGIGISRRTGMTVWINLTALCANIMLSIWWVPLYGASGALSANAVAFFVFFIARTEASAYVWHQFPRAQMYLIAGLVVSLALGTTALGPHAPVHYALIWLALLPAATWCFKREIKELFTLIHQLRSNCMANPT
jgi:O-antigen/teichoic acid export membrane protein